MRSTYDRKQRSPSEPASMHAAQRRRQIERLDFRRRFSFNPWRRQPFQWVTGRVLICQWDWRLNWDARYRPCSMKRKGW